MSIYMDTEALKRFADRKPGGPYATSIGRI